MKRAAPQEPPTWHTSDPKLSFGRSFEGAVADAWRHERPSKPLAHIHQAASESADEAGGIRIFLRRTVFEFLRDLEQVGDRALERGAHIRLLRYRIEFAKLSF
jgi:hypothetical protein